MLKAICQHNVPVPIQESNDQDWKFSKLTVVGHVPCDLSTIFFHGGNIDCTITGSGNFLFLLYRLSGKSKYIKR